MTDILAEICAAKKEHVVRRRNATSEAQLHDMTQQAEAPRGFIRALKARAQSGGYGLIAEVKKASPSKGIIRADFHPQQLAEAYAEGGAACLSVLTDVPYFQGDDAYLQLARDASGLPCLRKDFMLDTYQITESRVLGADCILLIMAALSDVQANELLHAAHTLHMDALIEVHDEYELERALTRLDGVQMIGINNRSLHTFETTLETTERLAKYLPSSILAVSESGIYTHADLERLAEHNIRCFLVGESLMREQDVKAATKRLLGT